MILIKRIMLAVSVTVLLGAGMDGLALAQNGAGTSVPGSSPSTNYATAASRKSVRFMKKAAEDNVAEVEEGRIAARKTHSPKVRAFAERMIRDHSEANDTLRQVARSLDVKLPSHPSRKERMHLRKLRTLSAARFDRVYDPMQVKAHEKAVHKFEQEAKEIVNPPLKGWVHESLPVLKQHLQLAEALPHARNTG